MDGGFVRAIEKVMTKVANSQCEGEEINVMGIDGGNDFNANKAIAIDLKLHCFLIRSLL